MYPVPANNGLYPEPPAGQLVGTFIFPPTNYAITIPLNGDVTKIVVVGRWPSQSSATTPLIAQAAQGAPGYIMKFQIQ